jgi:hypothetical protein
MIMVQKPLHLLSSPSTHHHLYPSTLPAVLVQPMHIPSLLSLSKPPLLLVLNSNSNNITTTMIASLAHHKTSRSRQPLLIRRNSSPQLC